MAVQEVVDEFCTTWFGSEAAPFMAEAIFQLEENLEEQSGAPLNKKAGINNYYNLVKKACKKMPSAIMANNWLWRMYMQKASLDKYTQLAVHQQMPLQNRIENHALKALKNINDNTEIDKMLAWFDEIPEMIRLRKKIGRLGEESNKLFG